MDLQLLDKKEMAAALKLSVRTLEHMVLNKKIPYLKLGGPVRFDPKRVQDWLQTREVKPR